jgi:hypothetical protein
MSEVLAPRLELFRHLAHSLAKPDEGVSRAMRVEVWHAGVGERRPKNCPNWLGTLLYV